MKIRGGRVTLMPEHYSFPSLELKVSVLQTNRDSSRKIETLQQDWISTCSWLSRFNRHRTVLGPSILLRCVKPYPEGWNLPGGGAQRGNLLNLNRAGDPLTHGYPAKVKCA
ncbi:hypothetical protein AMELA_G00288790 [Ameiurus melas]|uniref:Uncharacterized protein n=1 Tax=Ameiurus melas TaxID=219545 RepID=A0A7J5ZJ56_AMEME|nr:hypothetical protein AMELA_G00288790 [Ameiurus melas]